MLQVVSKGMREPSSGDGERSATSPIVGPVFATIIPFPPTDSNALLALRSEGLLQVRGDRWLGNAPRGAGGV